MGLLLILGFCVDLSYGEEKKELKKSIQNGIQVSGTFKVSGIETLKFSRSNSKFKRIYFEELASTKDRIRSLYLDTLHVHPALKLGASFELLAEINSKNQSDKALEAIQILLFIPQNGRKISVWLLSLKSKDLDLRGASYFKMHHPDFLIL